MILTPQGSQAIEELARRYCVSVDAVITLLQAVINGGGTMAQFYGRGQIPFHEHSRGQIPVKASAAFVGI